MKAYQFTLVNSKKLKKRKIKKSQKTNKQTLQNESYQP